MIMVVVVVGCGYWMEMGGEAPGVPGLVWSFQLDHGQMAFSADWLFLSLSLSIAANGVKLLRP